MSAQTLFKMSPADHQCLVALLRYLGGEGTEDELRAIVQASGRNLRNDIHLLVSDLATLLTLAVR